MSEWIEQKLLHAVKEGRLPSLLEWKETLFAMKLAEEALREADLWGVLPSWSSAKVSNALSTISELGGKDEK